MAGAKVSSRARVKMSERADASRIGFLPRGIVEPYSDMELKPLWLTKSVQSQRSTQNERCLIAIPAGINQKKSVDAIMKKRTLQLYCSTMMERSMSGMICHGAKV